MTDQLARITEIDWDFIVDTIRAEKCILFLGPDLFAEADAPPVEQRLVHYLALGENPDIKQFYPEDNLFLFSSRAKKTKTYYKVKNFYNEAFPRAEYLYEIISRIPFHFMINTTPDRVLDRVFTEQGIPHQFSYYWRKRKAEKAVRKPTVQNPLIYNMLGSVDQQESMLLTHNDIFEYFESVFAGSSFPERFKQEIKDADNFIFLGIPFHRWYMQLLLRILYIHNDYDFVRYAFNQSISDEIKVFCFEQFRIEFVPNEIEGFLTELLQRCEAAGLRREDRREDAPSPYAALRSLISKDQLEQAFEQGIDLFERTGSDQEETVDELILLSSKYRRLQKRINRGIITSEEAQVAAAKIRRAFIEIIKEAERL
jgi:hypothetical protein